MKKGIVVGVCGGIAILLALIERRRKKQDKEKTDQWAQELMRKAEEFNKACEEQSISKEEATKMFEDLNRQFHAETEDNGIDPRTYDLAIEED